VAAWKPDQTIGNLIDKQTTTFIGSVDVEGYPNLKAMLAPRRRVGLREFWFSTNTSSRRVAQSGPILGRVSTSWTEGSSEV
jgi:general stress protein 26